MFYQKGLNLVSSKSLLYALIFGSNMHKGLFLPTRSIFTLTNTIFETLFNKRDLLTYF